MKVLNVYIDLVTMTYKVLAGEMDYYSYSVEVRKPEYFFPQAIVLIAFLTIAVVITGFPLIGYIVLLYALLTGLIMMRKAYTFKKQMFMSFLWALQAFIVSVLIMVLAVYFKLI